MSLCSRRTIYSGANREREAMNEQNVFFGSWSDQRDMERDFGISGQLGSNIEILFASYSHFGYEGTAVVVFRDKDANKLFYVSATHCSCYDLEGQWEADEVYEEQLCAMNQADLNKESIFAYRALWPYKELPR